IAEQFPHQIDRFRRLLERIDRHDELALDRQAISGRAVVGDYLTDPVLVDMLFCPLMFYGSATPGDMDFNQFVIMFKSIFREGFARPFGGVRPLLKTLVKKFRSQGGELRLRSGVRRLHSDGSRVTAVELDNGEMLEANTVLSSAGSVETAALCEPPFQNDSGNESDSFQTPGGISFIETIFDIDIPPQDLGHRETIIFYNDSPEFCYEAPKQPADVRSGIICSPNNFQYETPLTENRIRITALADPHYWINCPDDEYADRKEIWKTRIVESALRFMPDFRPHVIDSDMFTPRTIRKFTGHINGAVYGAPRKIVDGKTPLKNLYLCGTDQGFLGIIGAMLSGISIANAYLLR
ncbi:MAG: NAD(P)/FAD-dependent oxidoreductase, partial [Planctomycetes bacterium]|nr:NAD(P)/FAD-dependent oxidoreductase [Planctomycetota bacterium]